MAKEYQAPKTANKIAMWFNRLGIGESETMTTTGRRSGEPRQVPVTPITVAGSEYLVAPYGEVSWVLNVRSNPEVTLRRGSRMRACTLVEVTDQAANVAKAYWDDQKHPRRYMDVPSDPTVEDFASVAGRFPVFRIEEME